MQFLKTLFWVALAIILVLFATVNWRPVTLTLWGGLEADVKLPVLLLVAFLLGFLPMLILHRARLWSVKRRLDAQERQAATVHNLPIDPAPPSAAPSEVHRPDDRIATDAKAWPTT
jgi:uncharacterized integral membrane protein